ncbi:hypothetical protein BKA81DRAFT_364988 [Phyllosticta paracitricarpa]
MPLLCSLPAASRLARCWRPSPIHVRRRSADNPLTSLEPSAVIAAARKSLSQQEFKSRLMAKQIGQNIANRQANQKGKEIKRATKKMRKMAVQKTTWWSNHWNQTLAAESMTESTPETHPDEKVLQPPVRLERQAWQTGDDTNDLQKPPGQDLPDFSTRQAVRHLLGLPNGSVPPLSLPLGPPVFMCLDLEAWEHKQDFILEVGLTILDLQKVSTYPHCKPWELLEHLDYQHYIVKRHRHRINKVYSRGCPNMFLFGESTVNSAQQIATKLNKGIAREKNFSDRPIVLVGHDFPSDERYLETIGVSARNWRNTVGIVDTKKIAEMESFPGKLERMLDRFRVPTPCAHNAGNDAAYTMHALLLFALYRDEWEHPDAMAKARSFFQELQRSRKPLDDILHEQHKESNFAAKAERKKMEKKLQRRGKASSTEMIVYDPAVSNGFGGWRARLT